MDVNGDASKVGCCKEQYCIGTWSVSSMNQGKLEAVKPEKRREAKDKGEKERDTRLNAEFQRIARSDRKPPK